MASAITLQKKREKSDQNNKLAKGSTKSSLEASVKEKENLNYKEISLTQ